MVETRRAKRLKTALNEDMTSGMPLSWPRDRIPVEIFDLIATYLSRSTIQKLRQVCREFDFKLSAFYFRNVVVPLRPELYGFLDTNCEVVVEGDVGQNQSNPAGSSLLKNGVRVFDSFGRHIRAFALSLELKEADLESPPIKVTQDIIAAPWGLYRWPCTNYTRFSELEGIENVADETRQMAISFNKLDSLRELGLSCDAGLGYLHGPDRNTLLDSRLPTVFKSCRYGPYGDGKRKEEGEEDEAGLKESARYLHLKKMVMKAGYSEDEAPAAIALLLECEGKSLDWLYAEEEDPLGSARNARSSSQGATVLPTFMADLPGLNLAHMVDVVNEVRNAGESDTLPSFRRRWKLTPKFLTESQKEMLLEMRWAHEALIQSYAIAVMDNSRVFSNLTKLTIARIPSSLINILARPDLWHSISSIEDVSLGVIPDWRSITQPGTAVIEDRPTSPLEAYSPVFNLLHNFIGHLPRLKSLHFEWICGGEFALGTSQRDRYILPAPITAVARAMTSPSVDGSSAEFLCLPHLETLSLKNCWATPHFLLHFIQRLTADSLQSIELDSVSISGPPAITAQESILVGADTARHWPWPLCAGGFPGRFFLRRPHQPHVANVAAALALNAADFQPLQEILGPHLGLGGFFGVNEAPDANPPLQQAPLPGIAAPKLFSWAHILDEITPYRTILQNIVGGIQDDDLKKFQDLKEAMSKHIPPHQEPIKQLKSATFKSCGYVLVDLAHVRNWDIIQNRWIRVPHQPETVTRLRELDKEMLVSNDPMLAKILNYMHEQEQHLLETTFGMHFGWNGVYGSIIRQAAIADGNPIPGAGRFTGGCNRMGILGLSVVDRANLAAEYDA